MFMMFMHCVLDMLGLFPARLSKKGQEHQAPAVEAGEQCRDDADDKAIHMIG